MTSEILNPTLIHSYEKKIAISDFLKLVDDKEINYFNYKYIENIESAREVIEMMLLRIPLPKIVFEMTADGSYNIVDGKSILNVIHGFCGNEFTFGNSVFFPDIDKVMFHKFDQKYARRILQFNLDIVIIDYDIPTVAKKILKEKIKNIYKRK